MALGKIKADTLEHSTAGSLDTKFVVNGSAKQWWYSGTDASISDSFNTSSGTDVGVGIYRANFTNSFVNVFWAGSGSGFINTGQDRKGQYSSAGSSSTGTLLLQIGATNTDFSGHGVGHGDLA